MIALYLYFQDFSCEFWTVRLERVAKFIARRFEFHAKLAVIFFLLFVHRRCFLREAGDELDDCEDGVGQDACQNAQQCCIQRSQSKLPLKTEADDDGGNADAALCPGEQSRSLPGTSGHAMPEGFPHIAVRGKRRFQVTARASYSIPHSYEGSGLADE